MFIVPTARSDGEAFRDRSLSLLRAHRSVLVRRLQRAFLRYLLDNGSNTSDAVRPLVPIPVGIDPRVVGSAVRALAAANGPIVSTGRTKSRRSEAHARKLDVWAIRDRAEALAWLDTHPEPTEPAIEDLAHSFAL